MGNINGVILINKPSFVTSHDMVGLTRRILKTKKVGHTGTLDPLANGVLPICVGNATKAVDMLICENKEYIAELILGMTTDTGDSEGEILSECGVNCSEDEIKKAVLSFVGNSLQIPPMYSAKKQNGKKLYELARQGITVERKHVPITIYYIEILSVDMNRLSAKFKVGCSKGTYIRTLCEDIGLKLKCGAYMNSLTRTKSGEFSLDNCITPKELEELFNSGKLSDYIIPTDSLFDYKKITLSEKQSERFKNGVLVSHPEIENDKKYRVYDFDGNFVAVAICVDDRLKTVKSFRS